MEEAEILDMLKKCGISIDVNDLSEIGENEEVLIISVNGDVKIEKNILDLIEYYKGKEEVGEDKND